MKILENSRWRTAAILKIALSPQLSRKLSDFHQIWYTDAYFHFEGGVLTKKKSKFCKFKTADGRHIENRFWLYLGAILPINTKFESEMKNHTRILVT